MEYFGLLVSGLVTYGPGLLFWIAVIILTSIVRRRGGGRAERFIIAGASVKIAGNLLSMLAVYIVPWSIGAGYDVETAASLSSAYGIFLNVISMAGILCLLYAFWAKFKEKNSEAAPVAAP